MQLVFTFTVAATFVRVERVRNYVKSTPTLLWLSVAICALLLIIFFTNKRTMRVHVRILCCLFGFSGEWGGFL